MLLTVPILYYKPIQEQSIKNLSWQQRQEGGETDGGGGRGRRVLRGTCEFKSNTVSFMFKGTFLFL